MARQTTSGVSRVNSSGSTRNSNKSYSKNTNKQKNKMVNNLTSTDTASSKGGQHTVSYKDTTGLSPEALALQNRLSGNTGYTPSQAVRNAYGQKQNAENAVAQYGDYKSSYQDAMQETINSILNMPKFSYDFNADALYKNYADRYAMQGKQAAQNAAAAASALTGGYGNSYAASAASQANEQYLTALNDKIPELQQLALERYNLENQNLMNRFSILGSQDDREYGRYNDARQYLVDDRAYYNDAYNAERQADMTNQQYDYDNAMNLLKYYTDLQVKDVSDVNNWSEDKAKKRTHEVNKTKNNTTQISNSSDSSTQRSSDSSVTTSSSTSNSSGSKGKKGNSLTGTAASEQTIKNVMSECKARLNREAEFGEETDTEKNNRDAVDYLDKAVSAGTIGKKDFNYIVSILGLKV